MLGLGLPELLVISFIMLLMFGASRLPKLAKSLGESAGELQKGFQHGIDKADNRPVATAAEVTTARRS